MNIKRILNTGYCLQIAALLLLTACIGGIKNVNGQGVTAVYDKDNNKIIIRNKTSKSIVLFNSNKQVNMDNLTTKKWTTDITPINKWQDNITTETNFPSIQIDSSKTSEIKINTSKKITDKSIVYYILDENKITGYGEVMITEKKEAQPTNNPPVSSSTEQNDPCKALESDIATWNNEIERLQGEYNSLETNPKLEAINQKITACDALAQNIHNIQNNVHVKCSETLVPLIHQVNKIKQDFENLRSKQTTTTATQTPTQTQRTRDVQRTNPCESLKNSIAAFKKETAVLQSVCKGLQQKKAQTGTLSSEDSLAAAQKIELCASLIDNIDNVKQSNQRIDKDCLPLMDTLTSLREQAETVRENFRLLLSDIPIDVFNKLKERYQANVLSIFHGLDTTVKQYINEYRDKNSILRWIGKFKHVKMLEEMVAKEDSIKQVSTLYLNNLLAENPTYQQANNKELVLGIGNALDPIQTNLANYLSELKDKAGDFATPYGTLIAVFVLLALLSLATVFYLRMFLKNRAIKKKNATSSEDVKIEIEIDEAPVVYETGLDKVRAEAGENYYEIDMRNLVDDTAIYKVYFSRSCILEIYKFFSDFLKSDKKTNETGCFLVGRWELATDDESQSYHISLDHIVKPGDDAIYGEYELNFGGQIGVSLHYAIEKLRKETSQEYVHTAWMHSHPGLQLFLSSQDLNVQSQLAYSNHPNRMLAIVIDSNTEDLRTAFFSPKSTGKMNNDTDLKATLSLEELYQWAKKPYTATPVVAAQNYYEIPIAEKQSKIAKISLSGAVIIDVDTKTDFSAFGVGGYFYGYMQQLDFQKQKEAVIEQFFINGETPADTKLNRTGILLVLPKTTFDEIKNYRNMIQAYDLFAVMCPDDDNIYWFTKNENNSYVNIGQASAIKPLMEMKAWTRRRRE
jgi:hypothetical protein